MRNIVWWRLGHMHFFGCIVFGVFCGVERFRKNNYNTHTMTRREFVFAGAAGCATAEGLTLTVPKPASGTAFFKVSTQRILTK